VLCVCVSVLVSVRLAVMVHLCQVTTRCCPEEVGQDPTIF
jgi:hypothetical protein